MLGAHLTRRSIRMVSEAVHNFQGFLLLLLLHRWNLKPGCITCFLYNYQIHVYYQCRSSLQIQHLFSANQICEMSHQKNSMWFVIVYPWTHVQCVCVSDRLVASEQSDSGSCTALCAVDRGMPSLWLVWQTCLQVNVERLVLLVFIAHPLPDCCFL
jgi:hypothetical protein